jgi:hypothetical protein
MRNNLIVKQIAEKFNQAFPTSKNRFNQRQSMVWLNTFIRQNFTQSTPTQMFMMGSEMTSVPEEGKMFMFSYFPKTAEQLPYFDTFPLILILKVEQSSMLGLNFHYIHPIHRIIIISELLELTTNPVYQINRNNKIRATYERLKVMANHQFYKPMVKRYLYSHVRSRLIQVDLDLAGIIINLPTERFQKSSQFTVWNSALK